MNRAFPYVSSDEIDEVVESQTPLLFKMVTTDNMSLPFVFLCLLVAWLIYFVNKRKIINFRFTRRILMLDYKL